MTMLEDVVAAGIAALPQSDWHRNPAPDGRWYWHASSLGHCQRQLILQRELGHVDPSTARSNMVLLLGTLWHAQFETWIKHFCSTRDNVEVVVQEVGQYHPTLNLAAKPDVMLKVDGRNLLVDLKSEDERSTAHRRNEAKDAGRSSAARPEHALQLTATAMCLEANGYTVDNGAIWYLSKSQGWTNEEAVDVHSPELRYEITTRVKLLDRAWEMHQQRLPARLPGDSWQCRPQKELPLAGEYCSVRSVCMGLPQ